MSSYIPNTDGLMRSTLRDTIKRLRRVCVKAGQKDEAEEHKSTGDPYQDLVNIFIDTVVATKEKIAARNESIRENGRDRLVIEESNIIRRDISQMRSVLASMDEEIQKKDAALRKLTSNKKTSRKIAPLQKNLDEMKRQYGDCANTLEYVVELDAEKLQSTVDGARAVTDVQFGRKMHLRQQLRGFKNGKNVTDLDAHADPNSDGFVDNTVGGGRLEENESTREQMTRIAKQDALIDEGLDRIKEGVGRLHNLAKEIGTQLDLQNEMLDEAETTVDKQTMQLRRLNRRLSRLLKETKPMSCFLYVCCVVLIIALIGFFLVQFSVI